VNVLARHTALKRWIATEIRCCRNVVFRGSAVQSVALLPISAMRLWLWASSDKGPKSLYRHRKKNMWVAESVLYLVVFYYCYYYCCCCCCCCIIHNFSARCLYSRRRHGIANDSVIPVSHASSPSPGAWTLVDVHDPAPRDVNKQHERCCNASICCCCRSTK